MKQCRKCGVVKPHTEYYNCKINSDGLMLWCKKCDSEHKKQYYNQRKSVLIVRSRNNFLKQILPYWIVYQLPKANDYVGYTHNPTNRMCRHKQDGNDSTGWIELGRFNTEAEAKAKEAEYHAMGYPGAKNWRQHKIA